LGYLNVGYPLGYLKIGYPNKRITLELAFPFPYQQIHIN